MATFKQTIEGMKAMEQPENQQPTAKKEAPMAEDKHKENRFDELSKTWKDKPHKVFNGKEYYVRPYTDLAGNRFYDINSKKQGEDFGLGSASGYEFKTEDEARKTIDEWEGYHRKKTEPKKLDFVSKNLDAILDHGIKNVHALTNEQYNDLAKKAMERFGIDDFKLAQEFIQSNDESDRDWVERYKAQQPKQGSFKQAINDISEAEQEDQMEEEQGDYQNGAKTHSENEFRLEALNDRGMYDFISKNRDYLYRKANSDPQGAIRDIISHGTTSYGIKPENIRKEWAMDVLKSFYEDDESAIPDFTKQEEFNPSEKIEEYDDYYGAKTASERDLNLLTGNDRGAYEYVNQNRDALAREAEYDPASVLNKIKWHAQNRNWARGLKGDSIRKDYLISVIKGIVED